MIRWLIVFFKTQPHHVLCSHSHRWEKAVVTSVCQHSQVNYLSIHGLLCRPYLGTIFGKTSAQKREVLVTFLHSIFEVIVAQFCTWDLPCTNWLPNSTGFNYIWKISNEVSKRLGGEIQEFSGPLQCKYWGRVIVVKSHTSHKCFPLF